MYGLVRRLLIPMLRDGQSVGLLAILAALAAGCAALLLATVGVWLLSGLWIVSRDSGFGPWTFVLAVLSALVAGAVAAFLVHRSLTRRSRVEIAAPTGSNVYLKDLQQRISEDKSVVSDRELERWREASQSTVDALKAKASDAVRRADDTMDKRDVVAAERALAALAAAHPDTARWVADMREDLAEIRKRI